MKGKKIRSKAKLEREVQRLRREVRRLKRPKKITKRELQRLLKQEKTTNAIAKYYRVSQSTINRKIREHGLTRIRKKGKKRLVKPRPTMPKAKWIETKKYINDLNKAYRFINIICPPFKYVNTKTLVCSDRKANPKGKFTTVGVYFIVEQSDVFFINYSRIRYSDKPVNFDEIYEWLKENIEDILSVQFQKAAFVIEKIIAFTFLLPEKKPKAIKAKRR
jgi:hypothetical protein